MDLSQDVARRINDIMSRPSNPVGTMGYRVTTDDCAFIRENVPAGWIVGESCGGPYWTKRLTNGHRVVVNPKSTEYAVEVYGPRGMIVAWSVPKIEPAAAMAAHIIDNAPERPRRGWFPVYAALFPQRTARPASR